MNGVEVPPHRRALAVSSGRDVNSQGRTYRNGAAYSTDLKLEVADAYLAAAGQTTGRPNISALATQFRVGREFVKKVEGELLSHGRIRPPEEIRASRDRVDGPGSLTLSGIDKYIIVRLYYGNPSRTLRSYRDWLLELTGTDISVDTISKLLLNGFPFKASLVKPILIPIDKFRPENEVKAFQYLWILF